MKEIRMAGKLECNFNTQLHRHMNNVGRKLNALVDAIKLARNDGYNLTVDTSKLEEETLLNMETNKTKEYTVKIRVDTDGLDEAIKKLKKINKFKKKSEQVTTVFNSKGELNKNNMRGILEGIELERKAVEKE